MNQESTFLNPEIVVEGRSDSYLQFLISLIILIAITYGVKLIYTKEGRTIGDKGYFSSMFFIWTLSVFLIVSVIKTSFILSLGMVGALSIVRFRNAIKDIEQVMYLLLLISLAIAMAANQYLIGLTIFLIFVFVHFFKKASGESEIPQFLYLRLDNKELFFEFLSLLESRGDKIISIQKIENVLEINSTLNGFKKDKDELIKWLDKNSQTYRMSLEYYI